MQSTISENSPSKFVDRTNDILAEQVINLDLRENVFLAFAKLPTKIQESMTSAEENIFETEYHSAIERKQKRMLEGADHDDEDDDEVEDLLTKFIK